MHNARRPVLPRNKRGGAVCICAERRRTSVIRHNIGVLPVREIEEEGRRRNGACALYGAEEMGGGRVGRANIVQITACVNHSKEEL